MFVLEACKYDEKGSKAVVMIGETEAVTQDGYGLLMRLPDKDFYPQIDMTSSVLDQSTFLKEK